MTEDDYKAEIARLTKERDELFATNGDIANTLGADSLRLRGALIHVRKIIKDAAMTGFNCHEGDWAERLFASQAITHSVLMGADDHSATQNEEHQ